MEPTGLTPKSRAYLDAVARRIAPMPPAAIAERVADLASAHVRWRRQTLNLLASENTISRRALALLGSAIATRLTEGFPGDKEFPPPRHNEQIDEIEAILIGFARRLIPARHLEWRAVSNTMANAMALAAVTAPGDRILVQALSGGGNMSYHRGAVPDLLHLEVENLPDGPDLGIDLDLARVRARQVRPAAIVVGGSYFLFPLPVADLRSIADEVGAALIYDAAHVGLFIAAGLFPHPLREGADILTMGTHKIMGGPIGGLVFTDRDDLGERIVGRTHPLFLQTRDQNKYAAAAHALAELVTHGGDYARQMVANAKALAAGLEQAGFVVLGATRGYTETHQVVLDVRSLGGATVEERCQAASILIHRGRVVSDRPDIGERSAIRISVQEVTRQGMGTTEMARIVRLVADATWQRRPTEAIAADASALAAAYPGIHYSFDDREG